MNYLNKKGIILFIENDFKIRKNCSSIIIEKSGSTFTIKQSIDGDIWFNTLNSNVKIAIKLNSINEEEFRSFIIFENLMKSIIGRYILNSDYRDNSILPKDFIDLDSKTIIWHSDNELDNILQLQFMKNEIIVSITRNENVNNINLNYNNSTKVRIRTSGSSYEYYYQEFVKFFNELFVFASKNELIEKQDIATNATNAFEQRKLSLFKKFKK